MDQEIKTSTWNGRTNYHCPEPCQGKWLTEEQVRDCIAGCVRQPKIAERVSPIVGPEGEEIVVQEETPAAPCLSAVGEVEFGAPTISAAEPDAEDEDDS